MKKIDFVLAKISGQNEATLNMGPFVFFPEKKVIKLDNLIEGYLKKRENIKKIFLLFDSRHLIKPIEVKVLNQIK